MVQRRRLSGGPWPAKKFLSGARIVQIIDAGDATTSDRPYRKAMAKAAAIAELRRQEGTQFDPKLVELFLRVIDRLERDGIAYRLNNKPGSAVHRRIALMTLFIVPTPL